MSDEIMRRMELELDARRDEIRTLRTQVRELVRVLIQLSNEVNGSLPLEEHIIRHAIGNTNYTCLIERAAQARAIVDKAHAMLKEGA